MRPRMEHAGSVAAIRARGVLGLTVLVGGILSAIVIGYAISRQDRPSAFRLIGWLDRAEGLVAGLEVGLVTCEARIVADGEQDGVIWDAIVRAIVSDESHAEPAASGDAHTSAHVASRLVLAMPGHKEDRRSVRGWCDENRCPSAAVAPGSREAVVPIAVTLRFASDGPCLHAAELTQSGAYLSASSSAKCAEAVGLAAAASARALCSAQMVHWASPKGAYSTVRQERLGIVLTIVLPSAGQVDDPECASDLAQAMATDFVPELGQGLQISEGLQGADLQGRVTAMPAWAGGLAAREDGTRVYDPASLYQALVAVGAVSTGSVSPTLPGYTRLEHHVVVVAPCSMGGAGSDVAVALPGSDAIKSFWTPQGDAVTVVTASELAAGLRGTDAWRVLKQSVRRHWGLPESYSALATLCGLLPSDSPCHWPGGRAGDASDAVVLPFEQAPMTEAARARMVALGAQAVYRLALLIGASEAVEMPTALGKDVEDALSVIERSTASTAQMSEAVQVLATLAVDDRVRIHSRWSLSSILQLYMLGLWPLVVAGVRPLSSLLSLASAA